MIKVAVVEDEENEIAVLGEGLKRYFGECAEQYELSVFRNGMEFLDAFRGGYDIILMDIEMPMLDGFRTAQKIREADGEVSIIFVTNMANYALKGYEVNAVGFMVKPVGYFALKRNLRRALSRIRLRARLKAANVTVVTRYGVNVIHSEKLVYVEVMKHNLAYHTTDGVINARGALKDVEQRLAGLGFARCSNCFLVNLAYVRSLDNDEVILPGERLSVSRGKKKEFTEALLEFAENTVGGGSDARLAGRDKPHRRRAAMPAVLCGTRDRSAAVRLIS